MSEGIERLAQLRLEDVQRLRAEAEALETERDQLKARLAWFEEREQQLKEVREDFADTVDGEWGPGVYPKTLKALDDWEHDHPKPE